MPNSNRPAPAEQAYLDRCVTNNKLQGELLSPSEMLKIHEILWANGFKVYTDGDVRFVQPGFRLDEHPLWHVRERRWYDAGNHAE